MFIAPHPPHVPAAQDKEGLSAVPDAPQGTVPAAFRGHCAACDAAHDSERFRSKPGGYRVPARDKWIGDFPFESAVNNRICRTCYESNRKRLLKAKIVRGDDLKHVEHPRTEEKGQDEFFLGSGVDECECSSAGRGGV